MSGSKLHGVVLFGCGLLAGLVLAAAPERAQPPRGQEHEQREVIAHVAGRDGQKTERAKAEADGAAADGNAAAEPDADPNTVRSSKAAQPRNKAKRTSELARRAVGFTVFVRGGTVYGAGVLLDRRGHVLTCQHVIDGLDRISVSFADGTTFEAKVIEADAELDLALLQIPPGRASEFVPASVTTVELGDDVFAIGAPRKMAFSLSRGMASYVGRPFGNIYYLQTDLAMNAGSSGGPVMNDEGEVIAISSFVLRNSEGLAFALPIDYAYRRFRKWLHTPKALEGAFAGAFEGWLAELDRARSATAAAY